MAHVNKNNQRRKDASRLRRQAEDEADPEGRFERARLRELARQRDRMIHEARERERDAGRQSWEQWQRRQEGDEDDDADSHHPDARSSND